MWVVYACAVNAEETLAYHLHARPILHVLGNHCFYNLSRPTLHTRLGLHAWTCDPSATTAVPLEASGSLPPAQQYEHSYYSISPAEGWRVVVVDAYDISMLGWPEDHPHYMQAAAILQQENINEACVCVCDIVYA